MNAAGTLFVAPDGEVLVVRRSAAARDYPGHWSIPAGELEGEETAEDAARREAIEEVGDSWGGEAIERRLAHRAMAQGGGHFTTFVQPVAQKFTPVLNQEHSGFAWSRLDDLPGPVHPELEGMLGEVGEGEGGADCALRESLRANDRALAFDRESVRTYDADGRLHVARTNISKATVNPYLGKEIPNCKELGLDPKKIYYLFRDPEELRKAAPTFNGLPLLRKHVPTSADDHQTEETCGSTGNEAQFDGTYLSNSIVVWPQKDIDGVESKSKCELSSSYRYRPDMTPGNFNGMRFDGVMRDIVGNHVALVEDGRAGPDVLVSDSNEEIDKMAKEKALIARSASVFAISTYLTPRLAADAAIDFGKLFDGITPAKFGKSKPIIKQRITEQTTGKLAADAKIDALDSLLDRLDGKEKDAGDESVSPEQHNAMAAAAEGNSNLGIPKATGAEFLSKDAIAGVSNFLKQKGVNDADISEAIGMLNKKPAQDEDNPDETEEERKKREAAEKAAASDESDDDEDKEKPVDKKAMDAAIEAASDATAKRVRTEQRAIRQAESDVRPYVGELAPGLAFDSAADVYRHALNMLGVKGAKDIHESALKTVLDMQQKAGARPAPVVHAMDASSVKSFAERFPDAAAITRV